MSQLCSLSSHGASALGLAMHSPNATRQPPPAAPNPTSPSSASSEDPHGRPVLRTAVVRCGPCLLPSLYFDSMTSCDITEYLLSSQSQSLYLGVLLLFFFFFVLLSTIYLTFSASSKSF